MSINLYKEVYKLPDADKDEFYDKFATALEDDLAFLPWEEIVNSPAMITIDMLYQQLTDETLHATRKVLNNYGIDGSKVTAGDILTWIEKDYQIREYMNFILKYVKSAYRFPYDKQKKKINLEDLSGDLDDEIGDEYFLDENSIIDLGTRDSCFLFINDEVVFGGKGDIHQDLLEKYQFDHDMDFSEPKSRMRTIGDTESLSPDTDSFSTGHIINNNAFIEITENCSFETVTQALLNTGKIDKVYKYDKNGNKTMLYRLASKMKQKGR